MKKIKSMSSVMRTSAFVGCIMIPVSFVIFLVAGFSDPEELHLFDVVVQPGMSILKRIMAMSPMAITLIFGTFVVYFLYRFFQALSQGEIFTKYAVQSLRKAAWFYLIGNLLHVISYAATVHFLQDFNWQTNIQLTFDILVENNITTPLLFLLFSWILEEGRKLKESSLAS